MIAGRFKLVIFDCDGVLVDSEPIINQAHAHVLTTCGYPITEQDLVERFCGMSDREMLEIIEREWGRVLPTSYAEHVGLMIEAGFRQSLAPIEGVVEALDSLKMPICVASSSSLEQIRQKLKITGLLGRFGEHLFSATMVASGKPAPDLFSLCRAAPYDGAGPLSRHRGQPCRYRCRPRRRHDRNRLLRWKPLRPGARGSFARARSPAGH
jgi:beta-phosphoglucomutase-like phosphatase (HAD superfamily)